MTLIERIGANKFRVSREGVALFNSRWPCSELRASRSYWFEYDASGDLVDTDIPQSDDGSAALALSQDVSAYMEDGTEPDWFPR